MPQIAVFIQVFQPYQKSILLPVCDLRPLHPSETPYLSGFQKSLNIAAAIFIYMYAREGSGWRPGRRSWREDAQGGGWNVGNWDSEERWWNVGWGCKKTHSMEYIRMLYIYLLFINVSIQNLWLWKWKQDLPLRPRERRAWQLTDSQWTFGGWFRGAARKEIFF